MHAYNNRLTEGTVTSKNLDLHLKSSYLAMLAFASSIPSMLSRYVSTFTLRFMLQDIFICS